MTTLHLVDSLGQTFDLVMPEIPMVSGFAFGVEVGANDIRHPGGNPTAIAWSYNTAKTALGRDLGSRLKFFDGGNGITYAVSMWQATGGAEPHPLYAIQTYTAAALNSWMSGLTFQCGLCLHQEFTADLAAGNYTPAQFNGWYADLRSIIDAHPNGHFVDLQMVGSEATERTASTPWWPQIVVPDRCAIGNDTYVQQGPQLDPAKAFANGLAWWQSVRGRNGVTWRTSEGGLSRINFTAAQRVQALKDYAAWLTVQGASSYNYWATNNGGPSQPTKDWSFDQPGDESVAATAASLITI